MENWPAYTWVMLGIMLAAITCLILFVFILYLVSNVFVLLMYMFYTVCLVTVMVLMSLSFDSHFHHYLVGLLIMTFCGHHNWLTSIIHGFACGMYIEGNCRYAMDPVWDIRKETMNEDVREWIFGPDGGVGVVQSSKLYSNKYSIPDSNISVYYI